MLFQNNSLNICTTAVKQFAVDRVADVLSQIPTELTATSSLSVSDGLYRTTANAGTLSGYSDAINTRAVTVSVTRIFTLSA